MDDNVTLLPYIEENVVNLDSLSLDNSIQEEDLKERIYWLDNIIKQDSLELVSYIIKWNREDIGIPVEKRKPIRIMFNSHGGCLDCMNIIVNIIQLSKTPVYGIALGEVASASATIYLSCHKKFALPSAYFILHYGSAEGFGGNYKDFVSAAKDYQQIVTEMISYYVNNTKLTADLLQDRLNEYSDWYLRGDDLIKYGFVDEWISDIALLL